MEVLDAVHVAGGLALFLLAMQMMTDGLKVFAGTGLKRLLERWTSSPLRGVFAGILVTGVVQSSSAVTIATIGFVNAGVLNFRQALGVIYGTNVGTTMTGWLVSLVGFGFAIEALALPILTVGVGLRLAGGSKEIQGLGAALAGFGLFFLGLAILKDAFAGLAASFGADVGSLGAGNWLRFVGIGFIATVLTQSSSAAIAIILTAASGGVLAFPAAAAAVIGANLGTTSTAAVAVFRATPAAKRLALGHIMFNLVTAAVALAILPGMLWLVAQVADWLDVDNSPTAALALFHTVFNVFGVMLMLPLSSVMASALERLFRNAEENLSRPQHLDPTVAAMPALAVSALREELLRLRAATAHLVSNALAGSRAPSSLEAQSAAVATLADTIIAFVAKVRIEEMSGEVAADLAQTLRTARYLDEAARLAPAAGALRTAVEQIEDTESRLALEQVFEAAGICQDLAARASDAPGHDLDRSAALEQFEARYETAKTTLLRAAVAHHLAVDATGTLLDQLSAMRRLAGQLVKADRLLRSPSRAAAIEAETAPTS